MRRPWAVAALGALCVGVYAFELSLDAAALEELLSAYGLVPRDLLRDPGPRALLSPLTALFLHADVTHLLANLVFLAAFGRDLETRLGSLRFLAFTLLCGLAAAAAHVAAAPDAFVPAVGASGAISGVLGGAVRLAPAGRVLGAPVAVWIVAWLVIQILSGVWTTAETDGVAIGVTSAGWAHWGGFAAGFAAARRFRPPAASR